MSIFKKLLIISASMMLAACMGASNGTNATTATQATAKKRVTVVHTKKAARKTTVAPTKPVNINTADAKTLAKVRGISMKRANAIVAYRTKNGNFTSTQDLVKVKGISKKFLKRVEKSLTV